MFNCCTVYCCTAVCPALDSLVPLLQTRLRAAVQAEQQHEEALIKALYSRGSLNRLQKDGLVLLSLQVGAVCMCMCVCGCVW